MGELMKCPVITDGAIMPDACPAGPQKATIPVGGVIAAENAILPSAHSADICCSMYATFYAERSEIGSELDALMTATRFGPGGRHFDDLVDHPVLDEDVWENRFLNGLRDRAKIHLADQGDGNHFAFLGEMQVTEEVGRQLREAGYVELAEMLMATYRCSGRLRVLVTHHGSRGLGAHVFRRGQAVAEKHCRQVGNHIPPAAAWIDAESEEGREYWEALQYVAQWTKTNHRVIHERFLQRIGAEKVADFGNEHNFVWKRGNRFLHGKGATPSWKDEEGRPLLGLIPLNMAEPILMVLGSDNEDYLSFAPHGAGRNLSRTALKRKFRSEDMRRSMIQHQTRNIDARWFLGQPDLSELPMAYKNADQVIQQIEHFDLAKIVARIKPLGCIMAGSSKVPSWKQKEEELTPKQKRQIQHRKERRQVRQDLSGF